jgi:hypothetical protein
LLKPRPDYINDMRGIMRKKDEILKTVYIKKVRVAGKYNSR